jgi:hypothetical protein
MKITNGLLSLLFFPAFTGVSCIGMKSYGAVSGDIILYIGFALMGIFWIWSVVNVLAHRT